MVEDFKALELSFIRIAINVKIKRKNNRLKIIENNYKAVNI